MKLPANIVRFFSKKGSVIVSSISPDEHIHTSVKGVVGIEEEGKVYVIDLYHNETFKNLSANNRVTLTGIDEKSFVGFALQGTGKVISYADAASHVVLAWENAIVKRITDRMIKNIQDGIKTHKHHEALLPDVPRYVIEVSVDRIVNLSPPASV